MDSEDRPAKIRKVSHGDDAEADNVGHFQHETSDKGNANSVVPKHEPNRDIDDEKKDKISGAEGNGVFFTTGQQNDVVTPLENAPLAATIDSAEGSPPLSKNQQKKLKKKLEWESKREERKTFRKERNVAKRERKREAKQQAALQSQDAGIEADPSKRPSYQKAVQLPITILIDCNFDEFMRDNERVSLGAQLTRSYSDNKNSRFRAHLTVCSFGGKLRERFDNILPHHKQWRGVRFLDEDFVESAEKAKQWMIDPTGGVMKGAFDKYAELDNAAIEELKQQAEVVYLSSEAEDTLTELKPYSTYIVGGLVDKNREKGICYKRATERGVRTAKLPIGDFLEMSSRKVLATNHVNEIMLKWLDCGDWGEAFIKVIPKRKGGRLKGSKDDHESGDADAQDEDNDAQEDEDADVQHEDGAEELVSAGLQDDRSVEITNEEKS